MNTTYPNINTLWSAVFVDELARCGIRHAVISPGSRSTPLALAFAAHPDIADHMVPDERSAAFFAFGLAKGNGGRPVALLCTSGTAAANYHPAVCEADLSEVPLVVLTADRPVHLRDSGAPQSMDQQHLYGTHVRWFHEVAQPEADEVKLRYLRSTACYAVSLAQGASPGPVHLNFPFRKPLEPTLSAESAAVSYTVTTGLHGRNDGRTFTRYAASPPVPTDADVSCLANLLRSYGRILVVAGPDAQGDAYRSALGRFSRTTGIPVFAEALSQHRFQHDRNELLFDSSSVLLASDAFKRAAVPDIILRLGAAPTGRSMQGFISSCTQALHIHITTSGKRQDPDHLAAQILRMQPAPFLTALATEFETRPLLSLDSIWIETVVDSARYAATLRKKKLQKAPGLFSGRIISEVCRALPDDSSLFVSNSMAVRDLEAFSASGEKDLRIFFNRGVNGIDGIISSALGVAHSAAGRTTLVIGDVAFLHDLNALSIAMREKIDLTIVLLNNDGGEIFATLPVQNFEPAFTKHFLTPHGTDFSAAAATFSIPYAKAHTTEEFLSHFNEWNGRNGVRIIEVPIRMKQNTRTRAAIIAAVSTALDVRTEKRTSAKAVVPTISAATFPLVWHLLRSGADEASLPAVLLHGFTRSAQSWKGVVSRMNEIRMIHAPDSMGHGASPSPSFEEYPDAYSLDYISDRLHDTVVQNSFRKIHLTGYSMGGRIALHYALRFPKTVASLTIISASPGIEIPAERKKREASDGKLAAGIEAGGLGAFVEEWMAQPIIHGGEETSGEARQDRLQQSAKGLSGALRGAGQGVMLPLWDKLPTIDLPVMLMAGASSKKDVTIMSRMNDLLPDSVLHIFVNTGHDILSAQEAALASRLEHFWRQHDII